MSINKIFQSKIFQGIIIGLGILVVLMLIFKAGLMIGAKKADFSHRFSDNYRRNFIGPAGNPQNGFFKELDEKNFMNPHGVDGQIIKIDNEELVIKDRDNVEKMVLLNDKTVINRFRDTIKPDELKVDEYVIVLGEPNDQGEIVAKLIRLMPAPPAPQK